MTITMKDAPWDDCENADLMRELIGFDDVFPYLKQSQEVPRAKA